MGYFDLFLGFGPGGEFRRLADHEDPGHEAVQSEARPRVQRPGLRLDHHLPRFSVRLPREYHPDRLLLYLGGRFGPGFRVRPLGSGKADLSDLGYNHTGICRPLGHAFFIFQSLLLISTRQVSEFGIKYAFLTHKEGSLHGPVSKEKK